MSYYTNYLTKRELEVLHLLSCGYTEPQIAKRLGIAYFTVRSYSKAMKWKLNTKSNHHSVVIAFKSGLLQ